MHLLGLSPMLALLGVGLVVAFRLIRLGEHTRASPELALGGGLLLVAVLGLPLSALGRLPSIGATGLGTALFHAGMLCVCCGIWLFYAFTWRVYYADSKPAMIWMVFISLVLIACFVGYAVITSMGGDLETAIRRGRPVGFCIIAATGGSFLWTSVESFRYHRMLMRRHALGLADPVVCNRVLLWALSGLAGTLMILAVIGFFLNDVVVVRSSPAITVISGMGSVMALCWYLAFLPPAAYLDWVRGEAIESSA